MAMFDEATNRKHIVMGGVTICASLFFAHVHRQMDLATGTGSFEKAPWSEGGRPFLKGEEKTIDGQQIHDICFLEAWPKGGRYSSLNQGDTLTAADYVSCQGRMIEERPQRLCQSGAKARYLRYLSGYFTWFKEDLARAKGEKVNRCRTRLAHCRPTENLRPARAVVREDRSRASHGRVAHCRELAAEKPCPGEPKDLQMSRTVGALTISQL